MRTTIRFLLSRPESPLAQRLTFTATNEVILSAGSIGTPTILLHSGIGDSKTLTGLGIPSLKNLPSVGQNLTDHSLLFLSFLVNSTNTFEAATRNATLAAQQLAQWTASRTGPLVDNPISHLGWLRVPSNSTVFSANGAQDTSAGPNTPHFELLISNGMIPPPPPAGNFLSVLTAVVSPASRASSSFILRLKNILLILNPILRRLDNHQQLRPARCPDHQPQPPRLSR